MIVRTLSFSLVGLAIAFLGCNGNGGAGKPAGPGSATIVVIGKQGVSKTYLLSDAAKIAALEAFFPNYRNRPTNPNAAGWKAGSYVYFDFPKGESLKLVVSPTGGANTYWTMGQGDHAVVGDFAKFLATLEQ
jgi:hypothetical protein